MDHDYTFDAFISYSHRDLDWGKWLQRKLESFHIPNDMRGDRPKGQKLRIFRDQTDLAGTGLQDSLQQNLHASRFLIVICSPSSAASSWVNEEVQFFISQGRVDKIIPFIVDGEPNSDDPSLECFPPSLRNIPGYTHLGANIQEIGRNKAFLKTVSILLDVRFGRLVDREKQRKLRTALIIGIITAVIAGTGGMLLWRNAVISRENRALNYDIYGAAMLSLSQKDVIEPEDVAFLRASAEEGNTTAMFYLLDCYKNGWGVEKDPEQEFYWSRKGAELGDVGCMIALANCYFYGEGTEKDYRESLAWDLRAAEAGSPSGMLDAAICYEDGYGVEADPVQAFKLYLECAEAELEKIPPHYRDNAEEARNLGMYNVARCYVSGTGTEKDVSKAFEWMHRLADTGNPYGMYNLGLMYQNGFGTQEDPESAYFWFRKAADAGDADGAYMTGWCLENQYGVTDPAVDWYRKAAEGGNAQAAEALERLKG
ncbi:MAG: toll/interleukin-1 receptor domain-containing protein [Clostridia bacterium]|nr:toll/interleukin-1 receptor domain-containing protein [Clostridia bacterium]